MKALTPGEYNALRDVERLPSNDVPPALMARGYVRAGEPVTCAFCSRKHPIGYVVTELGKLAMRCYELARRLSA